MQNLAEARGRKKRKVGTATVPTSENFVITNSDKSNLSDRQTQRLVRLLGLPEPRARFIAALAFGGAAAHRLASLLAMALNDRSSELRWAMN